MARVTIKLSFSVDALKYEGKNKWMPSLDMSAPHTRTHNHIEHSHTHNLNYDIEQCKCLHVVLIWCRASIALTRVFR